MLVAHPDRLRLRLGGAQLLERVDLLPRHVEAGLDGARETLVGEEKLREGALGVERVGSNEREAQWVSVVRQLEAVALDGRRGEREGLGVVVELDQRMDSIRDRRDHPVGRESLFRDRRLEVLVGLLEVGLRSLGMIALELVYPAVEVFAA